MTDILLSEFSESPHSLLLTIYIRFNLVKDHSNAGEAFSKYR